jgi:NAD(P)-dependent dehydrogenase (short-subunit alcohol dehydrogenase family)
MMNDHSLIGKNVLITGAAKRIGRAIALGFASEGANIAIHYRSSKTEAEKLCLELDKKKVGYWLLQADFGKKADYESLVDHAFETAGHLDILVNNASVFPESTLQNVTFAGVMKNIEINSWAPFYISRAFARKVKQGAIVNMLDTRIRGFDLHHVAYILSKQILESLTRMMALEWAPGIRVNAVAPGLILPPDGKDNSYLDALTYSVPLKKHGNLHQITEAVLFLVKNEFTTGQILYVDGGRHIKEFQHE